MNHFLTFSLLLPSSPFFFSISSNHLFDSSPSFLVWAVSSSSLGPGWEKKLLVWVDGRQKTDTLRVRRHRERIFYIFRMVNKKGFFDSCVRGGTEIGNTRGRFIFHYRVGFWSFLGWQTRRLNTAWIFYHSRLHSFFYSTGSYQFCINQ